MPPILRHHTTPAAGPWRPWTGDYAAIDKKFVLFAVRLYDVPKQYQWSSFSGLAIYDPELSVVVVDGHRVDIEEQFAFFSLLSFPEIEESAVPTS